ncbi:M48 family metallopeptidase [Kitasatospora viridis]|uniref:Zn-dependent protease with chaperone function n=1 Tax=Kitasatospora viridis TaxID=281105 RepID=A0A561SFT8_9ACTN|nr:M48 family metallopeptidase [Kitasatospora viridis]TWF73745.1 Zn-dependent protease with chaperone function [Kitasatospora viridis]
MSFTTVSRACPNCAAPIESDSRFTDWCPGCDWNLGAEAPAPGRRAERCRARDRARVEALYQRLAASESQESGRHGAAWLAAVLIAGLVHLWTLAVLAGSLWLLLQPAAPLKGLGVVGLALAWLLRPRLGRWRRDPAALDRDRAPALYALLDRTADQLGTRRPDRIRITGAWNASYRRAGLRRRVEVTLGLPLWTVLTGPERIALLGHELGHGSNGDARRGFWLETALRTLEAWYQLLTPRSGEAFLGYRARRAATDALASALLNWLALPVRWVHGVLYRLTMRSSQRAEYRADDLAARAGSSADAATMLGKLLLGPGVATRITQQRAAHQHTRPGAGEDPAERFWTGLREYVDSIPGTERERRARLGERGMSAVDTSHPPTHLRVRMRAERPAQAALVTADATEWDAIHAELAPARRRVAEQLLGI